MHCPPFTYRRDARGRLDFASRLSRRDSSLPENGLQHHAGVANLDRRKNARETLRLLGRLPRYSEERPVGER